MSKHIARDFDLGLFCNLDDLGSLEFCLVSKQTQPINKE